jgi:hypothetical protein
MKKYIFPLAISLFLLAACTSKIDFSAPSITVPKVNPTTDLIISELATAINTYTGPTGAKDRNHYVELWNGTANTLDLSQYAIGYCAVSDTGTHTPWSFPAGNYFILGGSLAAYKAYVVASPIADTSVLKGDTTWGTTNTASSAASSPLQLSGNSAIALLKKDAAGTYSLGGVNYDLLDVFCSPLVSRLAYQGTQSSRNNIFWAIGDTTADTRNRTFKRKPSATGPESDWNISNASGNSQWEVSGNKLWDYSNVGLPTVN